MDSDSMGRTTERFVRRILPRSFLGRSLLIVFIPLLVTQAVALELFYGNYLNVVSRRLSDSVVADIGMTLDMVNRDPREKVWILQRARLWTQLDMTFFPHEPFRQVPSSFVLGPMDEDLAHAIRLAFGKPCQIDWRATPQGVQIDMPMNGGILRVIAPRKRLDVGPIWLFVAWAAGSALLLFAIASVFIRNQVRAIRRLAQAAEHFGLGRDLGPIHPEGAQEIRKAAVAFNRMQARVNRFVTQRTAVLAGVSHDLRTPLTRLRLTLAMIPLDGVVSCVELRPDIDDMVADIEEMERLIGSYLSFARGEGAEEPVPVDLGALVRDVAVDAQRAGGEVLAVHVADNLTAIVRPDAIRRVLNNLADNARRHGGRMSFSVGVRGKTIEIAIDDDGPGIARSRREMVFRAFMTEGGPPGSSGLGLTIARDIMRAHGGGINLKNSPLGGLRVVLTLPQ